jgi:hypothetical protein
MWALIVRDGAGAFQNELRPEPGKADRDLLAAAGLVSATKRGRRYWIEVTDRGWAWAGDNLAASLPRTSNAGTPILQAWLSRLKAFLDARGMVLAEILAPPPASEAAPAAPATPAPDHAAVRDRIRRAYLDATGGRLNARVPLADIRARLADVDRDTLDAALRAMHLEEGTTLSGLDNPVEITPAIRAAGLSFKGEPMFVLWITK